MIEAKVIEKSISHHGKLLTTFELRYQRFIHAEAKTHRVVSLNTDEYELILTQDASLMDDKNLSRNASSSRAIPTAKLLAQVACQPAMPVHWGKNQAGMQAQQELQEPQLSMVKGDWQNAAVMASHFAKEMADKGAHKQIVNRGLEPYCFISVIVTATELDNFFALRAHADAQPEIRELAYAMQRATTLVSPARRGFDRTTARNWHLPYVTNLERARYENDPIHLAKLSAARCARESYLTHDGKEPDAQLDLALYDRLVGSKPLHASPVEHQATPAVLATTESNNFRGWRQFREKVEAHMACGEPL